MTTFLYISTLVPNTLLYGAILFYVRKNSRRIQDVIGDQAQTAKGYTKAAKTMSMFVLAFLMQWSFVCIYSVWQLLGTPHVAVFFLVVIFTNLGGFFNFVLYRAIQRNDKIVPRMSTHRNETNLQVAASKAEPKSSIIHVSTKSKLGDDRNDNETKISSENSSKGKKSIGINIFIQTDTTALNSNIEIVT